MTLADFERIIELRKLMTFELTETEIAHEQATNITVHLTGMPSGSSKPGSMVENAVIRAEMHYAKYCKYRDELTGICARLKKECAKLAEDQRKVVEMYYIEGYKVGKIAQDTGMSERHVFRLKKEAIGLLCSEFLP